MSHSRAGPLHAAGFGDGGTSRSLLRESSPGELSLDARATTHKCLHDSSPVLSNGAHFCQWRVSESAARLGANLGPLSPLQDAITAARHPNAANGVVRLDLLEE